MRDQAMPNGVIINDAYCDRSMTRDYDREALNAFFATLVDLLFFDTKTCEIGVVTLMGPFPTPERFCRVFQAAAVQHFDYGRASVVIAHCPEFLYNSP